MVNNGSKYQKNKSNWVSYKSGKKKIKLRKHISNIAREIHSYSHNKDSYISIKNHLIDIYNESKGNDGLKVVNDYIIFHYEKHLECLSKVASDLVESIEKI